MLHVMEIYTKNIKLKNQIYVGVQSVMCFLRLIWIKSTLALK